MRSIKRGAVILRVIGIVLLFFAAVMTVYSLASTGGSWSGMSGKLNEVGVKTGIADRIRFNGMYYNAMSEAVSGAGTPAAARARNIERWFENFKTRAQAAEDAKKEADVQDVYAYFENEFDAAAFIGRYEQMENREEEQRLSEAFEYLDSLTVPAAKPGKKLPALQAASARPAFEAYYETLVAEHGEEAGSFVEFCETVADMIREAAGKGDPAASAAAYLDALEYDDYLAALPKIQSQAHDESGDNLLDSFVPFAERKAAGESADFAAFFKEAYEKLQARYPDAPAYDVFVRTAGRALEDSAFNGDYVSLIAAMRAAQNEQSDASFESFLTRTCRSYVDDAESRSKIGLVSVFWKAVSLLWLFWLAGFALIILAYVIEKVLSHALISSREKKHIQDDGDVLLRVNHLKQYFKSGEYVNKAVDDVSFFVKKGEVFGLVGESGCGKTTTGRTIINLYDPTDGDVYFQGLRISSTQNGLPVKLYSLRSAYRRDVAELKKALDENVQREPQKEAAFKAEYSEKVKALKAELDEKIEQSQIHGLESAIEKSRCVELYREKRKAELTERFEAEKKGLSGAALEALKQRYDVEMKVAEKDNIMTRMQMIFQDPIASINPRMTVREIIAEGLRIRGVTDKKYIDERVYEMLELVGLVREHADRYPHEFSGGQRQRIGIARAIIMEPDLIIADEPISALDVSIQAQVINLLNELRNKMGLTLMFIAHNLSVVKYFCDRIAVMYYGKIVEMTTSDELFEHPLHPYTKSLLSAIPYPDPHYEKQRRRIEYNPVTAHDYSTDKPSMREITPGHFIYCNDAELQNYRKELGL